MATLSGNPKAPMSAPLKSVLCGIGGFGEWYLGNFLDRRDNPISLAGFVDPSPERSTFFGKIRAAGTPIYPSLEEFYARDNAQLAILASPIQHHGAQTLCALEHGSHVLCEKPLCATVQDAHCMLAAQRRAGRVVTIGYQGSFMESTRKLKADILAGVWGRPLMLKCAALCPRSREYYRRNAWAGRIKDSRGRWVLDSPVNNATSHYLHHMLYLLGDSPARSALPHRIAAGLYRAHAIENYDTAFLSCTVANGVQVFFVTSHACSRQYGPVFEFVFENGTVKHELPGGEIVGTHADGTRQSYGDGTHDGDRKVLETVSAIHAGRESLCGIEAAMSQTVCMNGAQESGTPVTDIPGELVREVETKGEHWLEVEGLDDLLMRAYHSVSLPGPAEAAWAKPARTIALDGYASFPKGAH